MVQGQEANSGNLGREIPSIFYTVILCLVNLNRLDEAILMSTHNIQFHNEIRIFP